MPKKPEIKTEGPTPSENVAHLKYGIITDINTKTGKKRHYQEGRTRITAYFRARGVPLSPLELRSLVKKYGDLPTAEKALIKLIDTGEIEKIIKKRQNFTAEDKLRLGIGRPTHEKSYKKEIDTISQKGIVKVSALTMLSEWKKQRKADKNIKTKPKGGLK